MKFLQTLAASASVLGLANAQNTPTKIAILTPLEGTEVGVEGLGWMIDVVAEFSPSTTAAAASAGSSSSAAPPASTSASTGSAGGFSYKRATSPDDGFFPFLNSPNLTSFAPGPDPAAPGFVCLVSTASDPTQNFAGVFQLNGITNSDAEGNILEAYFQWYVGGPDFGVNKNSTVTAFFLKGAAPAKYTANPMTDPNVISNVATSSFFINGKAASNTTDVAAAIATPISITVFTPRAGEVVGIDGAGWEIDMVLSNKDAKGNPNGNPFAPANGYKPLYHDNFTANFVPGVSVAIPGLVVTSNTSVIKGGATTNLANLFQMNAISGIKNGIITDFWSTWFIGDAFAGVGVPSSLTIYVVNGTAPATITAMPTNIISDVVNVSFTISSNVSAAAAANTTAAAGSGATTLTVGAGTFLLAGLAFLL